MADNIVDKDHEIALFTGKLQTIISLLHKRLQAFIIENLPNKNVDKINKMDFSKCIYCILENWKYVFAKVCDKNLKKIAERSVSIRNYVSHQTLNNQNDFSRHVETFRQLAIHVKCDIACIEIDKMVGNSVDKQKKTNSEWLKLKETGNEYFKKGQWTEAMISYTKAIAIDNKQAVLYSNRALAELKLKKYEEAREDAEDAIELDEKNVKYFRLLSEALQYLDLTDEAVNACKKGLELNKRDEILLIRLRDLNAVVSRKATDKNPSDLKERLQKMQVDPKYLMDGMKKMFDVENPNPADIKTLSEKEFWKHSKSTRELYEAHNYHHGIRGKPKDLRKAFEIFEKVARDDCAEALYNLGRFYSSGEGACETDFGRMWELYKKAASQKPFYKVPQAFSVLGRVMLNCGVAEAELGMGNAYRNGCGVDIDNEKAFKHFLRSAELGCANAQNNLGVFLYRGTGVERNLEYAREWYRRAAEQGNGEAQLNYAEMLEKGEGGPACESEAIEYYKKAVNQGSPQALMRLQRITASNPKNKIENEKVSKIFDRAESDPNLLFIKGLNYYEGQYGFEKNNELAYKCWKQAADEHDHVESINALYKLLLWKMKRSKEGFKYCLKAAKNGDYDTQVELAELYAYGHGCNRDEGEAKKWWKRAKLQIPKYKDVDEFEKHFEFLIENGQKVCEFEFKNNLSCNGMARDERIMRSFKDQTKGSTETNVFESLIESMRKPNPLPCNPKEKPNFSYMPKLIEYARNGSLTALNELNSLKLVCDAKECIDTNQYEEAATFLREAYHLRCGRSLFMVEKEDLIKALDTIDSKNEDALVVRAFTFQNDIKGCIAYLKRCIRQHPNIADLHNQLGCMYGFNQNYEESLREINRALELQYRPYWLYDKATALRLCYKKKEDCKKIIDAYHEFIKSNPPDNRKIPQAYYSIACMYILIDDSMSVRLNYFKGKCADDNLLPCFEKDDSFPPKVSAEMFLAVSKDISSCGNCGKDNPKYKCVCAEQAYCDKNCQTSHWWLHKKICKTKHKK